MSVFNSQAYLQRIGLSRVPNIDLAGLKCLHNAQHANIAFENFDLVLGKGIDLSTAAIMDKLVMSKRGGYCFEVNQLMLLALQHFGFIARPLLARVHLGPQPTGRSHQLCLVSLAGEDWLVDTGFGSQTPRDPLPLRLNEALHTDLQTFRLLEDEHFAYLLQGQIDGQWQDLYSFDLGYVCDGDISYANHCTATMPTSTFVTSWVACLRTPYGNNTLLNDQAKQALAEGQSKLLQPLAGEEYMQVLMDLFGINLDASYDQFRPF